jgi:hypothetical protein
MDPTKSYRSAASLKTIALDSPARDTNCKGETFCFDHCSTIGRSNQNIFSQIVFQDTSHNLIRFMQLFETGRQARSARSAIEQNNVYLENEWSCDYMTLQLETGGNSTGSWSQLKLDHSHGQSFFSGFPEESRPWRRTGGVDIATKRRSVGITPCLSHPGNSHGRL